MYERYPFPMKCPECGKIMRPVHKNCVPDMPRHYFCTFCDAMISEEHPSIHFSEPYTNIDNIRSMSTEELANFFAKIQRNVLQTMFNIVAMKPKINKDELAQEWKKWLEEEVDHSSIK